MPKKSRRKKRFENTGALYRANGAHDVDDIDVTEVSDDIVVFEDFEWVQPEDVTTYESPNPGTAIALLDPGAREALRERRGEPRLHNRPLVSLQGNGMWVASWRGKHSTAWNPGDAIWAVGFTEGFGDKRGEI